MLKSNRPFHHYDCWRKDEEPYRVTATATRALSENKINIQMMSQGSSEVSIMFVVNKKARKSRSSRLSIMPFSVKVRKTNHVSNHSIKSLTSKLRDILPLYLWKSWKIFSGDQALEFYPDVNRTIYSNPWSSIQQIGPRKWSQDQSSTLGFFTDQGKFLLLQKTLELSSKSLGKN